jgi:hypothetical protein
MRQYKARWKAKLEQLELWLVSCTIDIELKSGEHLIPEAALEALADQNISFTVEGKSTYEQQIAPVRDSTSAPI